MLRRVPRALLSVAVAAALLPLATARAQLGEEDWADGSVSGRLFDPETGEGIAGEQIRLSWVPPTGDSGYPYPWVPEIGAGQTQALFQVTDTHGHFRFTGLASGSYSLRSYIPLEAPVGAVAISPMDPEHSVEMRAGLGRRLVGRVVRPDGTVAPGARVALVGAEDEVGENALWQDRPLGREVRGDGSFLLADLPEGALWVQAYHEDHGFSRALRLPADERTPERELVLRQESDRLFPLERGTFGGIGVQVGRGPRGPRIDAVSPGLPAAAAGILPGDVVTEIDGHPTRFMAFDEFLMRCRGPVGRALTLRLERGDGTLSVELTRVDIRQEEP